jgi:hypothetical protein
MYSKNWKCLPRLFDIFNISDAANGDVVDVVFKGELDVLFVLLTNGRELLNDVTREGDAL